MQAKQNESYINIIWFFDSLQRALATVFKGALATGLLAAGFYISTHCFDEWYYTSRQPPESWSDILQTASKKAIGGAALGGTSTAAVLLLDSVMEDLKQGTEERASRTLGGEWFQARDY